jgi:hypothetical protein
MLDSRGGFVGSEEGALEEIIQRGAEKFGEAIALKTHDYTLNVSADHGLNPSIIFKQADPLPITLLSLVSRLV